MLYMWNLPYHWKFSSKRNKLSENCGIETNQQQK